LEIQWQDHFQTRTQTWKTLEISALLAVALVGIDWRIGNPLVTIVAASLLILVTQFGIQITLKHRKVEREKFLIIETVEKELELDEVRRKALQGEADRNNKKGGGIDLIYWKSIFHFKKSNTPLFILRMHFVIQLFAAGNLVIRLIGILK